MKFQVRKSYIAIGAGLALALAAIVHADSASQARVCRSIAVVLNPAESKLQVLSSSSVASGQGIMLTYAVILTTVPPRSRKLVCVFATNRLGPDELLTVASDGRQLGPARLGFLKRFWLRSPEATAAESSFNR
jgi:hypothetical protein